MATKPLKTLTFEGLNDTYTVPQVDSTLSVTGKAADAKVTGDTLAEKADKDGVIATAEGIIGGAYTVEKEPYHFRKTAVDLAGRLDETIVGGSLGWNQLYAPLTASSQSGIAMTFQDGVMTLNGTATANAFFSNNISVLAGYKYLICGGLSDSLFTTSYLYASYDSKYSNLYGGNVATVVSVGATQTMGVTVRVSNGASCAGVKYIPQVYDLTTLFGSTIADYIYSLEQSNAGAGVAWVKRYIDLDTYHEYDAGSIQSVEGLESHKTYDEDENLLASYPLDSSVTLRGVPKLVNDHIEFDGDKYKSDGTVERRYGERAYQSGDESLANAITDGTTTVYKLATPTTETAQPFQSPMIVGATEEYISDSVVPVGHESKYYEDVAKKVSGLPKDFSTLIAPTEVTFTATRNYSVGNYLIIKNQLYKVTSAISSGGTITPNSNVTATTIMAEILALA